MVTVSKLRMEADTAERPGPEVSKVLIFIAIATYSSIMRY